MQSFTMVYDNCLMLLFVVVLFRFSLSKLVVDDEEARDISPFLFACFRTSACVCN